MRSTPGKFSEKLPRVTKGKFLIGFVLIVAASSLYADPEAARKEYELGQKYQASKQWGPAVRQYLKALETEPKYVWAYKALGTTYYLAGDRRGALAYYNRYLKDQPQDLTTLEFARKLQASLSQTPAPSQIVTSKNVAATPKGGFDLRLAAALLMNSGSDIASLYTSPYQTAAPSGGMAASYGLGVDYSFSNGIALGLDLLSGPSRGYHVSFSGNSGITDDWTISNFGLLFGLGWRIYFGRHWILEPKINLGYAMTQLKYQSNPGGRGGTASAGGIEYYPKLRTEIVLGRWGMGLNLGYLLANATPVTDERGNKIQQISVDGKASDWSLQNGGPSIDLELAYHFQPPF